MKLSPATILSEMKARNVRKTLAIYVSSALTTIAAMKLVTETYSLSTAIFPVVVTVLICGLASAFVFAWYHGGGGSVGPRRNEIILYTTIGAIALVISFRVGNVTKPGRPAMDAKSIAVLPFKNFGTDQEDEYFSDGITEDILTQLCRIGDLRVISRTSIMQYKDTKKTTREIAEELGVGTILEGSVRRAGDRVRIVGQLINARTDEHLWAGTYDREIRDIFAIQSEVAQHIARELQAKLLPKEIDLIQKQPTQNLDAYLLYLKGRDCYNRYRKNDNEKAIELFRRGLLLDSTYALAYAGLSDAYCQRYLKFGFSKSYLDSSLAYGAKALAIDPTLAEAHKAMALAYDNSGFRDRARTHYAEAIRLNPNYAPALNNIGWLTSQEGRLDEALQWTKKAVTLAPTNPVGYVQVGQLYQLMGADSQAVLCFNRALVLDTANIYALCQLGWLYLSAGDLPTARTYSARVLTIEPELFVGLDLAGQIETVAGNYVLAKQYYERASAGAPEDARVPLALALWRMGNRAGARTILSDRLRQNSLALESEKTNYMLSFENAMISATLGLTSDAVRWIQRAIEGGWRDYRWASVDPAFDQLRDDKAFKQAIQGLKSFVGEMRRRTLESEQSPS